MALLYYGPARTPQMTPGNLGPNVQGWANNMARANHPALPMGARHQNAVLGRGRQKNRGRGTPYRPPQTGYLPPPATLPAPHVTSGFPVGSVNLKPSKFSGGFSMILKNNIQRDRQERQRAAAGSAPVYSPPPPAVGVGRYRGRDGRIRTSTGGGQSSGQGGNLEYQPSGFLAEFLTQADKAQQEANAKNEQRYADILAGYDTRLSRATGDLSQLGATEKLAIDDRYKQGRSQAEQDLIDRGLGNTTVRSSVMRGYDAERDRALTRLNEDNARLRLQYIPALEQDRLAFMERRDDAAPDPLTYAQLAQAVGAAGVGGEPAGATNSTAKRPETDPMKRRIAALRKRLPAAFAAKLPQYPR